MKAKKKTVSKIEAPKVTLVHRFTPRGAHRLEKHTESQAPVVGDWVGSKGIAILGDFRGTTEYFDSVLPTVFKVIPAVAHEVTE